MKVGRDAQLPVRSAKIFNSSSFVIFIFVIFIFKLDLQYRYFVKRKGREKYSNHYQRKLALILKQISPTNAIRKCVEVRREFIS